MDTHYGLIIQLWTLHDGYIETTYEAMFEKRMLETLCLEQDFGGLGDTAKAQKMI